ncbi:ribonucleotide-diphosphate reductase subunit beta, partial [Clostridioides difficile]
HGKYIGLLAQEIYDSFDKMDKEMLEEKMYSILYSLMENEIEYTNVIYRESGLEKEVVNFLKYNANRALENLG